MVAIEPLWREVLGRRLRALRLARGERLVETAARAGISPQYLSEIERGRKEPSSEMVAAIAGALGIMLVDLTARVTADLRRGAVVVDLRAADVGLSAVDGLAVGPDFGLGEAPSAFLAMAA